MDNISRKKILVLLAAVIGLVVFQREVLIPMAKDVATKTDLFLIDSKDPASMISQSNDMTQFAFQHCNTHLKNELEKDKSIIVTLPEKPLNAWSLGNYEYVVSAEADVSNDKTKKHKYLCRITYKNSDDISGAANFENWSLDGLTNPEGNQ